MKRRTTLILTGLILMATALSAQGFDEAALYERLGLEENEIGRIREAGYEAAELNREAGVEQKLIQARMEKLLLSPNPDMAAVEALLRESLEWKLKVELAKIERSVEVRRILGEERWLDLLQLRRKMRERQTQN